MNKKLYLTIILLIVSSVAIYAQSGINSTVRVEREYEGKVMEVDKARIKTAVSDTLLNFKLHFDYPTFYRPYRDLYEFSPVSTAQIKPSGVVRYPWLYTKLSVAYPLMPVAEIYVAPRFGSKFTALLHFNHHSLWSKSLGDRMTNDAGVNLAYKWSKGEAVVDFGYSGNFYTYMSDTAKISDHHFDIFNVRANLRSTDKAPNAFYYDVMLGYSYMADTQSNPLIGAIKENSIKGDISLGATIRRVHKVFVQVRNDLSMIDNYTLAEHYTVGLFDIRPTYRWERGRWRLNLGVSVSSLYSQGNVDMDGKFVFAPNVQASFEAVPSKFWLYADVQGENSMMSMAEMFKYNPWMGSDFRVGRNVSPFGAQIGWRGVAGDQFGYNLYGGYRYYTCYSSFVTYNDAQAVLSGANNNAYVAAELMWNTRSFKLMADAKYQYFSNREYALMTPSFEAHLNAEYNLRQRFYISADCYFRNRTLAGVLGDDQTVAYSSVNGFVDLGLKLTYVLNPGFSVFLEGKNLINSKIQYFSNTYEPGVNIAAGLYFKL